MGRILGIDYGVKRIGLALSDPLGITARPLSVLEHSSAADDLRKIGEVARDHAVTRVVVGLPLNMDGTDGMLAPEVREFAQRLAAELHVDVELYDERLTTLQADRMLTEEADMSREKRKQVRDKIAASLILQSYLERSR